MKKAIACFGAVFALFPLAALAHEGHGYVSPGSPMHYLAEPEHTVILLVAVFIIGGLIFRYARQSKKP
jgi:hypothetical protein